MSNNNNNNKNGQHGHNQNQGHKQGQHGHNQNPKHGQQGQANQSPEQKKHGWCSSHNGPKAKCNCE